MKKIIATVLAMVMALALCSTAFAATDTWTIYVLDEDGNVVDGRDSKEYWETGLTKEDAKTTGDVKNVEYWVEDNGTSHWVACDKDDCNPNTTSGEYYVICKNGTSYDKGSFYAYVMYIGENNEGAKYTKTVTEQDETDKDASCTVDHYLTDGYVDDDGDFYVQSDSGVYTARISGTNKIVKINTSTEVVYASHILGEAVKNSDKGYYEATCLVCGAKVALTSDLNVLKNNSIAEKDTYKYDADDAEAVADDNDNKGAYKFAVGTKFAGDYTYAWDLTSGSSSSTTTDKTSPKTFDAGVAMYVGMALASVTGSAVVIGKKKEF